MSSPSPADLVPIWRRPAVILAVALAVRLVTVLPALDTPPFADEIGYHGLAERLAAGRGYCFEDGRPTSWRPPLWPGVLAALYRATGPSPAAGRLLQVVLGSLLVGLVMVLAGVIAPSDQRAAAVAGWWASLSPTLLYYSHTLLSETAFALCLGVGLLGLLRSRESTSWRWVGTAGVALGLACLARGSTLLLVPPALVWLASSRGYGRADLARAALTGLLCAMVIAPWTYRNYRVHGGPILIDSNGGVNLFYGNHPNAPRLRPWEVVELPRKPFPQVKADAGEVALQRRAVYEASVFIRERPGAFLLGLLIKTGNLWGLSRGLAGGVGAGLYGQASRPVVALVAAVAGIEGLALLCLGVLGMAFSAPRPAVEIEVLVAAYLTIVHAVSYGHSRYRFGALPLLFGFAAVALLAQREWRERLAAMSRARRSWTLGIIGLLLVNFVYEVVVLELLPLLARGAGA